MTRISGTRSDLEIIAALGERIGALRVAYNTLDNYGARCNNLEQEIEKIERDLESIYTALEVPEASTSTTPDIWSRCSICGQRFCSDHTSGGT